MSKPPHRWTPTTNTSERNDRLHRLLPLQRPQNSDLESRIRRLESRYALFLKTAPIPLWSPGLVATNEMHRQVELYLPVAEIQAALASTFRIASAPSFSPPPGFMGSWYGFLDYLDLVDCPVNPAKLLRRLIDDYDFRVKFLFALFLPRHFGGAFGRYPRQMEMAADFVCLRGRNGGTIRCLDAACGTGEQAWELAGILSEAGLPFQVEGTSVDPFEVFAAAHVFFPHDHEREAKYRAMVAPTLNQRMGDIVFGVEDLLQPEAASVDYDLILCNGFIGGPFLHDPVAVGKVVGSLAGRLRQGGLLLAADRFHEGWKKIFPPEKLRWIFMEAGLQLVDTEEGIAGKRLRTHRAAL